MEMTDEEFFQKAYLVALAGAPAMRVVTCGDLRTIASNAVKMFHEEFRGKPPVDAPPDPQFIRSKCTHCGAVNEAEIDLTDYPEGTQITKHCDHCETDFTHEVRIDNS